MSPGAAAAAHRGGSFIRRRSRRVVSPFLLLLLVLLSLILLSNVGTVQLVLAAAVANPPGAVDNRLSSNGHRNSSSLVGAPNVAAAAGLLRGAGGGGGGTGDRHRRRKNATGTKAARPPAATSTRELGGADEGEALIEASLVVPLTAASGTHHVTVYAGQPPQPQSLIVDTGSHLTAWTCSDCVDCGRRPALPRYDPRASTTRRELSCGECELSSSATTSNNNGDNVELCRYVGGITGEGNRRHQCPLSQRYTEGSSWSAYEINDLVTFKPYYGGTAADSNNSSSAAAAEEEEENAMDWSAAFTFGCQTSLTGLFRKQHANGILGLERSPHSVVSQMHRQKLIPRNAFSLCIGSASNDVDALSSSTANENSKQNLSGLMAFGGAVTSRHLEPMKFTPLVRRERKIGGKPNNDGPLMYAIHVEQLWLGGTCVVCPGSGGGEDGDGDRLRRAFADGKGTLLDSGTTDTFLPGEVGPAFAGAWKEETGGLNYARQRSKRYTYEEFEKLPTMYVVLRGNVTIEVPPFHYMENAVSETEWKRRGSSTTRELTNRIYADEPRGAVLGLNVQRGYDIYYAQDRAGIAKAKCDDGD